MAISRSPSRSSSPARSSSSKPESSPADRVSAAFERLIASAAELNTISDELAKPIVDIEVALKKLNLGISTWVEFAGDVDHNLGCFWNRSLGYAKLRGKWGIAIRAQAGDFAYPPGDSEEWLFREAPRTYRLEAVDRLPDLLEELIATADKTAERLKEKIRTTKQVAKAIGQLTSASPVERK